MRIFYLSNSLIPSTKANSIQVMKMCQAFSNQGNEVTLYCRKPPAAETPENIFRYYGIENPFRIESIHLPRVQFLSRILFSVIVLWRLRKENAEGMIYGRDRYLLGALSMLGLLRRPFAFEAHTPPSDGFQSYLQKKIFSHRKFVRLVVISEALKNEYLRRYGKLLDGKIIVAHDGADGAQIPEKLILNENSFPERPTFKVGYIGHLYPGKGMEMIAALPELLPEVEFHVVGGNPEDIAKWKNKVNASNLIFHGFVAPEKVYDYMAEFDVMLMPYQPNVLVGNKKIDIGSWMSPLKLFEYMGGGKPIIASDLPVLREVLTDGRNALLVEATNPSAWAMKIRLLRNNPELRRKIAENAQHDFFNVYTWDKRAELILEQIA
ncbi:MAG: glycosyltransferase family 4 protein [Bacteroidia bacterium]|nr:glycosyltransferase family 4 protein [Bacteroidia bacterium]